MASHCIVAQFSNEEQAREVEQELREFLFEHARQYDLLEDKLEPTGIQLEFGRKYSLDWETELIRWSDYIELVGFMATLAVQDKTLVLYQENANALRPLLKYLEARGAETGGSYKFFPTLSVRLNLPEGDMGQKLLGELSDFFGLVNFDADVASLWKRTPWELNELIPCDNEVLYENMLFYQDGQLVLFFLPIAPCDVSVLEAYLKEHAVESFRLRLCALEDKRKLEILLWARNCPEWGTAALQYHSAELEGIPEDQLSCRVFCLFAR